MENDNWIGEHNRRLGVSIMFRLRKIIKQAKSEYFDIIVADTEPIGRVLVFREKDSYTIQSAEFYDFYDEMLAHIPMAAHPNPRRVLIIGGGDGIVLREVLKYPSVERVLLIEVDPMVVNISKKYLRLDSGGFDDPRLEIVFCDAAEKVANLNEKFDVIIGDYSDPYQDLPAGPLIEESFYRNIYRLLDDDGFLSVQAGSPIFQRDILLKVYRNARRVFPVVKIYWAPVIYYPGAIWAFMIATKGADPETPRNSVKETTFYNAEIHKIAFILPEFIRNILRDENEA